MSTKRKGNDKGGLSLIRAMVGQVTGLNEHRDRLAMSLRMARQLLESRDAAADHWIDIADSINICGMYAMEQQNEAWLAVLQAGAKALDSVRARHDRVGGRWAATDAEIAPITEAINMVDETIFRVISANDFIRLGVALEEMKKEWAK